MQTESTEVSTISGLAASRSVIATRNNRNYIIIQLIFEGRVLITSYPGLLIPQRLSLAILTRGKAW